MGSGPRQGGQAHCTRLPLSQAQRLPDKLLFWQDLQNPSRPRPVLPPQTHLREALALPTTQGLPASVRAHTFQVQTVNAVPEVCELLGKQIGQWLRQEDTSKGQARPLTVGQLGL